MSEHEQSQILDPQGKPAVRLVAGRACTECGGPGNNVLQAFGGGVRCWTCGYQEGIDNGEKS